MIEAVKDVVESHGKTLTPEAVQASSGRRPLEAWQAVKDILDIDCTAQQLFAESEPVLTERSAVFLSHMSCYQTPQHRVMVPTQHCDLLSTSCPHEHLDYRPIRLPVGAGPKRLILFYVKGSTFHKYVYTKISWLQVMGHNFATATNCANRTDSTSCANGLQIMGHNFARA